MQILMSSRQRTGWRRWMNRGIPALVLVAVLAAFYFSNAIGDLLAARRERLATRQVSELAAQSGNDAVLSALKQSLAANPTNDQGLRLGADLLEAAGSKESLQLRRQLVVMRSGRLADRLELVSSALRFRDFETAESALRVFTASERSRPEVSIVAAGLAIAQERGAATEATLVALRRDNLDSPHGRLELDAELLEAKNVDRAQEARLELEALAAAGDTRQRARLELLRDATVHRHLDEAFKWAQALASDPSATMEDKLAQLNVERAALGKSTTASLARAQERARTPAEIGELADWLNLTGQSRTAREWLELQPASVKSAIQVRSALADACVALGDWPAAATLVEGGAWGRASWDVVQAAITVQTLRIRGRPGLASDLWQDTLANARSSASAVRVLLHLAAVWGWDEGRASALDALVRTEPKAEWAVLELASYYRQQKDSLRLAELWTYWSGSHPDDRLAANNATMMALLMNASETSAAVIKTAQALYDLDPTNPRIVATQGLVLLRRKLPGEAVAVFERLPTSELAATETALYYGAALAAIGRRGEADYHLRLVQAAALLPEEQVLLDASLSETRSDRP